MKTLSKQDIQRELKPYGISADSRLCEAISEYVSLLLKWNQKISLTSVTDPLEIVRFHFGESLFAAVSLPITDGRLADVGSGAGFPGLPIQMVSASIDLLLIEPNMKKAAFLAEVIRHLKIERVEVFRGRFEDLPDGPARFEFITARALGHQDDLLHWATPRLQASGKAVLWLGADDASTISLGSGWKWAPPVKVPGSQRRVILIGSPVRPPGQIVSRETF